MQIFVTSTVLYNTALLYDKWNTEVHTCKWQREVRSLLSSRIDADLYNMHLFNGDA